MDSAFTSSPDSEEFENEWSEFQRNFNCSYFIGFEKEFDLNTDKENEVFIIGKYSGYKADSELFVFQKHNGLWKIILYTIAAEHEIQKKKTSNYFDIKTETSFSGGNQSINFFKFNGKKYIENDCFVNGIVVDKGDETIVVNEPITRRQKCFQKFSKNLD